MRIDKDGFVQFDFGDFRTKERAVKTIENLSESLVMAIASFALSSDQSPFDIWVVISNHMSQRVAKLDDDELLNSMRRGISKEG